MNNLKKTRRKKWNGEDFSSDPTKLQGSLQTHQHHQFKVLTFGQNINIIWAEHQHSEQPTPKTRLN